MSDVRYSLLHQCTVRLSRPGAQGTGFFVAPGLVLTCAHVVTGPAGAAQGPISVHLGGQIYPVRAVERLFAESARDLALLRLDLIDHPCIYLRHVGVPSDKLYAYGYVRERDRLESVELTHEGWIHENGQELLKLKQGVVEPGMSGSAVLHIASGSVCGMIKFTRDRYSDLGGGAVQTNAILATIPELAEWNAAYHRADKRWANAWQGLQDPAPSSPASAILYRAPGIPTRPPRLIGRDTLLRQVEPLLEQGEQIALVGMAGMGKTALAATIAERHLSERGGPVLWLQAAKETVARLIEVVASRLGGQQTVSSQALLDQIDTLRSLIERTGVGLVVIDDARDGEALYELLRAIPGRTPVVVTSRQSLLRIEYSVDKLAPKAALSLLSEHGGADYSADPDAAELCRRLGYHSYAIEIAGNLMRKRRRTAREQLELIEQAPHELELPNRFGPVGRTGLPQLFDDSFASLEPQAQAVFLACGEFFVPGISAELLATYLNQPLGRVVNALDQLMLSSLAWRKDTSNFYSMHDLAFSYVHARSLSHHSAQERVVAAAEGYMHSYASRHSLIEDDLPQLLGAAQLASPEQLVRLLCWLAVGGYPAPQDLSYVDERGHTTALLEQLDRAIAAAAQLGADYSQAHHYLLVKRGNAELYRGNLERAQTIYAAALELAPSAGRQAIVLALLGQVHAGQQRVEEAELHMSRAAELAQESGGDALAFVTFHRSTLAGNLGRHQAARELAAEAAELYRSLHNQTMLGFALLNLGSAQFDLGDVHAALAAHQEVLTIGRAKGDQQLIAYGLHALAEDHYLLGDADNARRNFKEALAICRRSGFIDQATHIVASLQAKGYSGLDA